MADGFPSPLTEADFLPVDADQARLGQLLFYDKVLSGNRNISCGTCHHHDLGGTDGLSLGIGEGGVGLGRRRTPGEGDTAIRKRIPRNAPALWNLGHAGIEVLFHDGRLSVNDSFAGGFASPAQNALPVGLTSITSAQALFPMTAEFEMAGNPGENEVADAIPQGVDRAWPLIVARLREIPAYPPLFIDAFETVATPEDISIVDVANALGAFINAEWRNHDSPFDRWLEGDLMAMKPTEVRGMIQFYGAAGCATCHAGPLLTDQQFHAVGLPQFGPGRTRAFDPMPRDVGRLGVSNQIEDAYRFRTPALRNVALTAPYGHNGAYPTLEGMVRQHLDPARMRTTWQPDLAMLPNVPWLAEADFILRSDSLELARQDAALDLRALPLAERDIADLVAFLRALTGESALTRPLGRPMSVPSGLPVD